MNDIREHARDDVKFIAIGYNDASTNFLVKFHHGDFDRLEQAIVNVGEYNEYQGAAVAKVFAKIKHLALFASFGREGSPVLYIHLRREYGDNIPAGTGNPIGAEEVLTAFAKMRKSKPDEIDVDGYNNALIRVWWD